MDRLRSPFWRVARCQLSRRLRKYSMTERFVFCAPNRLPLCVFIVAHWLPNYAGPLRGSNLGDQSAMLRKAPCRPRKPASCGATVVLLQHSQDF